MEGFIDVGGVSEIAVGRVRTRIIGDRKRLEYTVIGDAVNLAAKLEKHNKVERTRAVTTRTAYELALAQGYAIQKTRLPGCRVAGVQDPIDLVSLAELADTDLQRKSAGAAAG